MIDIEKLRKANYLAGVDELIDELQASQIRESDLHKRNAVLKAELQAARELLGRYKKLIETQAKEMELQKAVFYSSYDLVKELDEQMPEMERNEALDFPFAGIRTQMKDCKAAQRALDIWYSEQEKAGD